MPRSLFVLLAVIMLSACGARQVVSTSASEPPPARPADHAYQHALHPNETHELRALIVKYATLYDVPVELVQRQIIRESTHRPDARNGPYWGLMQILPQTARTMGHRGPPEELLNPDINLKYAVKYLRGAWIVSGGDMDKAMMWYAKGYYYEAKRLGLLRETCLKGCVLDG